MTSDNEDMNHLLTFGKENGYVNYYLLQES